MNYNFIKREVPQPIRAIDERFPHGMEDPHFLDDRFKGSKPLSTFLAEGYDVVSKNGYETVTDEDVIYLHFDRLLTSVQSDRSGAIEAARKVEGGRKTPLFYQEYLRAYFEDDNLELVHVLAGVQASGNGMPYWALGFKSLVASEDMANSSSDK